MAKCIGFLLLQLYFGNQDIHHMEHYAFILIPTSLIRENWEHTLYFNAIVFNLLPTYILHIFVVPFYAIILPLPLGNSHMKQKILKLCSLNMIFTC
jgi:hypothetical protein